jgi:carboxylate-amine ligase
VAEAATELADLRARLAGALGRHGLRPAVAGAHPSAVWNDTAVSSHPRYRYIGDSMRVVARREPTLALHVHVGIARRQAAIRVMNRLRVHLPLLLALSANRSPPGSPARIARTLPFEVDRRYEPPSRAV